MHAAAAARLNEDGTAPRRSSAKVTAAHKGAVMHEFLENAFPDDFLLTHHGNATMRMLDVVLKNHPYTAMFTGPSLSNTRTMRWLTLIRVILIALFVNTMFFYVFYPSDGTCTSLSTEAACLQTPSQINSQSHQCRWDPTGSPQCTVNPPPHNSTFKFVVAFLTILIVVPIDVTMGFVQNEFARKRPRFSPVRLDAEGKPVSKVRRNSILNEITDYFNHQEVDVENHVSEGEINFGVVLKAPKRTDTRTITDPLTDLFSPEEEARLIMRKIQEFFRMADVDAGNALWSQQKTSERLAKIRAIQRYFGVHGDGTLLPLTYRQSLSFKWPRDYLVYKMEKVRENVKELKLRMDEQAATTLHQDVILIQEFILACMPPLKRYVLSTYFFKFADLPPRHVRTHLKAN
jgi:hypothetical protein